jgi:hypothetical protein
VRQSILQRQRWHESRRARGISVGTWTRIQRHVPSPHLPKRRSIEATRFGTACLIRLIKLRGTNFATGIDNPYSRRNRQSYVEEIFDIAGYPSGRRILASRYGCHCKGKAAHVSTKRFCSPPKHWGRKALAFSNLAAAVLD